MLNDLMCYYTFIGRWKELSPPEIIALKREADRLFLSVAPLFSQQAVDEYQRFMDRCFLTYGDWGTDARLRTGFVRRREAWPSEWPAEWDERFSNPEDQEIEQSELAEIRSAYDSVLAALVEDIELSTPRDRYAPTEPNIGAR